MRLIDADAFIEYLGLDTEEAREENIGEIVTLEDFDRQPTAYDVEKVVAELEEEKTMAYDKCDGGSSYKAYSQAIEIVRKGGVE